MLDPFAGEGEFLKVVARHTTASLVPVVSVFYGTLDVPYGDVMRLRIGEYDLPGNGGGDPNGIFRAAWYSPSNTGDYHIVGGDTWTAAIEFSQPYRAQVVLPAGNATQPGSPHVGDQLSLFSEKRMRDAWLTREAVEANLELYEVVQQN